MIKKIFCVLLAALMAAALCACAKPDDKDNNSGSVVTEDTGIKPEKTAAQATEASEATAAAPTEESTDNGSYFEPTEGGETAFDEADPDTVLLSFTGIKQAEVTAEMLSGMDVYDYSESDGEDTPVYSGALVSEVLRLIGANSAKSITVSLGGSDMTLDFLLSDMDLSSAIFAVIKDGKLITDGSSMIIFTTADGFNYILSVADPYILG